MAAQEERLKADIERAKQDLVRDLEELRGRTATLAKQIAMVLGALVAAYAAFRMIRFVRDRRRQD